MPKVSVIVPNYNHAVYLNQRLNSILDQTWQDFELIILDDCSTDNSREMIEKYRHHPKLSHIVFNDKNSGGPFHQWKKGIELAGGEYIWIAESDDWCEPTLLATLVQGMDDNPACTLAYVQTHTVTDDNVILQTSAHNQLAEYINGRQYIKDHLVNHCTIWNASMLIFRKSYYQHVSDRFTSFNMSGDWLFYVEMARQGDVFISGKVLNYFRNHDGDVSGKMYNSGNNYLEELCILKIMKADGLLSEKEFKAHLLEKYIRFTVFRYKFTAGVQAAIAQAFYNHGAIAYQTFLRFNGQMSLLKIRINRRLNRLFK